MKRRVLCIFGLIFWLLGLATFLSLKIEEAMKPVVITTSMPTGPNVKDPFISGRCLFEDETGSRLFAVVGSDGWELSLRAMEEYPGLYTVTGEKIVANYGVRFVRYATKKPQDGGPVVLAEKKEQGEDVLLVLSGAEPQEAVVLARGDGILLAEVAQIDLPFMEKQAQEILYPQGTPPMIFSLGEFSGMMEQLPKLGSLAGILLFVLIVWAWALFRRKQVDLGRAAVCGLTALLLLGAAALLVGSLELPSSLLPTDHILEIGHYQREFGQIFSALETLAGQGSAAALQALQSARGQIGIFWLFAFVGVLSGAGSRVARHIIVQHDASKQAVKPGRHFGET